MTHCRCRSSSVHSQSKSHFEQNADTYTEDLAHVVDHLSEDGVDVLAVSNFLCRGRTGNTTELLCLAQKYYQDHILDEQLIRSFKRMKSSLFEGKNNERAYSSQTTADICDGFPRLP